MSLCCKVYYSFSTCLGSLVVAQWPALFFNRGFHQQPPFLSPLMSTNTAFSLRPCLVFSPSSHSQNFDKTAALYRISSQKFLLQSTYKNEMAIPSTFFISIERSLLTKLIAGLNSRPWIEFLNSFWRWEFNSSTMVYVITGNAAPLCEGVRGE